MKNFKWMGVSTPIFIGLAIVVLLGTFLGTTDADGVFTPYLPHTMVGALSFLFVFGVFFGTIGDKIPVWNKYIGGGAILVFVLAAIIATYQLIPEGVITTVTDFYDEWDFLSLFISVLICGSILGVERKLLIRSLGGYIPAILGGLVVAGILGILAGLIFGVSPTLSLLNYVLPIMGGGTGAGAIPMSQMYERATGNPANNWFAFAISILTIANIFSIISGSLLNALGKKRPELTGEGELVRVTSTELKDASDEAEAEKFKPTTKEYAAALMFATTAFVFAQLFAGNWPWTRMFSNLGFSIHHYAYLVIFVAVLNIANLIPVEVKEGCKAMSKFFSSYFLWVLMAAVGMTTDVNEIIAAINPQNLIIALAVVVGAMIGSGAVGQLVGFYPIETAITAGLCMANRGGSGDIAVLGAANRMDLISYAQISSRIGGSIILIIASILFGLFL
jgi:Na+/citrate or Na+/malate symporter